jgi:hypothetical protein
MPLPFLHLSTFRPDTFITKSPDEHFRINRLISGWQFRTGYNVIFQTFYPVTTLAIEMCMFRTPGNGRIKCINHCLMIHYNPVNDLLFLQHPEGTVKGTAIVIPCYPIPYLMFRQRPSCIHYRLYNPFPARGTHKAMLMKD